MLAAGEGSVAVLGGIEAVGAGLVLVVGLVVPGPVVEILVLVGGLGAVEPVEPLSVAVVLVLSRASTAAVQPTTLKPAL